MKNNKLIVLGVIGLKRAYLNISKEEALARFEKSEGYSPEEYDIKTFEFDDEFSVYDAWE